MATTIAKKSSNQAASTRDLKNRVLTCLRKLSDRDTHSAAAKELESIAKSLTRDSIPPFVSSISTTDAADKSTVRRQCLNLISLLSEHHGNTLFPYLSKLLTAIVRRLRDNDSSVRSACVSASASISSHLTRPPFSSIVKPFVDALVAEQDLNSQIGAALCIASAIDAAADPEPLYLRRLLPRLEKLLKCESFKAKAALLSLIGSVISVGGAASPQAVRNLVSCMMEFLNNNDWAARKAASEALFKMAVVERDALSEFKASCLKTFEAKRYDKVKSVRETMNQTLESWKKIPDLSDEISLPPESQSSSKEDASDGLYPPASKISATFSCRTPQMRKKNALIDRSPLPDDGSLATTSRKTSPLEGNNKKTGRAIFKKLNPNKPKDRKEEIYTCYNSLRVGVGEDDPMDGNKGVLERGQGNRLARIKMRHALSSKHSDEKMQSSSGFKTGSCVVQCDNERSESTVVVSNATGNLNRDQKECEDLSLIRKQLVQIENQQSYLLDLLQKFIGSSQNGMNSLEARVHGLELAMDEISFNLAMSTGRMSNTNSAGTMCCMLPGADFFSSKFRRKTEGLYRTSQFSSNGTPSVASLRNIANKNGDNERFNIQARRFSLQGVGEVIVNPLAKIHNDLLGTSQISSNRVSNDVHNAV